MPAIRATRDAVCGDGPRGVCLKAVQAPISFGGYIHISSFSRTISFGDLLPVALVTKTPQLPNAEMTKLCEVSDETSTHRRTVSGFRLTVSRTFYFQCLTLQSDTSTLNLRLGGSGRVA